MRFTKISGIFIKFDDGERLDTGVAYASQDLRIDQQEILVRTLGHGNPIETRFSLQGPDFLDFVAISIGSKIPAMTGHFFNSEYDECIMSAELYEQNLKVSGVVTKLDHLYALSTKTLTDMTSGRNVGVVQERIELITEDSFNEAIRYL